MTIKTAASNTNCAQEFLYSVFGDDPDLGELVEVFVAEMPDRIADLNQAADAENWEQLSRLAHQLKGASGSYGFNQITPYALTLEQHARADGDVARIRHSLEALIAMLQRLRAGVCP